MKKSVCTKSEAGVPIHFVSRSDAVIFGSFFFLDFCMEN